MILLRRTTKENEKSNHTKVITQVNDDPINKIKTEDVTHPVTINAPVFEMGGLLNGEIYISEIAKKKLDSYIRHCDQEISGLGFVDIINNKTIIDDVFIIKQTCTVGSTDIDDDAESEFLSQNINHIDRIKLWWHSHCNMECFWSTTDKTTIEKFCNKWMLSIVGNKKGEYLCRLDMYSPFRITIDKIPIIHFHVDGDIDERIKKEIKEKVSLPIYNYNGQTNQSCYYPKIRSYFEYDQQLWKKMGNTTKEKDDIIDTTNDKDDLYFAKMYF